MAALTPGQAKRDVPFDLTSLVAAAGGGDTFANDGQTFFIVKNGDASDHTVTFAQQLAQDGVTPTNPARNVTAGHTCIFGPFPTGIYNGSDNLGVHVSYSAVTSVTVAAVKFPPVS